MKRVFGLGCLALALVTHPPTAPTSTSSSVCTCKAAVLANGWCGKCEVGYVASVTIKSHTLFEALDAHGHDIDAALIECPACREAVASDGYCDGHRIGFVAEHAYASRLTYYLAKGKPQDVAKLTCETCRTNAKRHRRKSPQASGWCDTCQVGLVGNVAFKSKADYDHAAKEFKKLLAAVRTIKRCELCAAAIVYDTRCPKCKIEYKDGKVVEEGTKAPRHEGTKGREKGDDPGDGSSSPDSWILTPDSFSYYGAPARSGHEQTGRLS